MKQPCASRAAYNSKAMTWNVDTDVPDLSGRVFVVTGCSSNGVGFYAALRFAKHGGTVVMACRNATKMQNAADAIRAQVPGAELVQLIVDTSDLDSVRRFAAEFRERGPPKIDVLLLNAGIGNGEGTSPQGADLLFATNHLGHWLMTGLLLDLMSHPGARIVSVSSLAHRLVSGINYDVASGKAPREYGDFKSYSESKLANHWFVAELNRRLLLTKSPIVAVCAHPGCAWTDILKNNDNGWSAYIRRKLVHPIVYMLCQSAENGSWPLVMAATDPDISREKHYGPSGPFEMYGAPKANAIQSELCSDEAKAKELWETSESCTNFKYNT